MENNSVKVNIVKNPKVKKTITVLIEEMVASAIRYRRLFESAKDGILILDAKSGMIVDVNPFLIDLLGYSKEEFMEKSIWEIGSFKDIFENKGKFIELQQNKYVRYEDLPLETSDGSKIHVEFVSNVYLVNNSKVIQCNIRDITERNKSEVILENTRKELAEIKRTADELNEFTENMIDTVREPLLAIDKDLRVIKASRSFYNFFKVTADETIGKLIYELGNHQWDIPKLKELLEKIIPKKSSFDNYEVEHNFSSIGKRVMLLNARQVKRAFGKEKIILLAIEDITERKGKEDILQETHRSTSGSLNTLLDLMQAPIIIWDTSMTIKHFNRQFELLSGYSSAEVIGKKIDFLFPKENVEATLELLKNHLEDEPEVDEIAILTKDNHIRTVLWNSTRILDMEGKNIVATISQDITNRKATEDALTISENRYRRLFESAVDGILIIDAETGKIVDVNPFLIDLLGYSKEEFIEKSIWEIGSLKDIYENKEKFLKLQQNKYIRFDDLPLVTSAGHIIHVELVSNVYLANNSKVIQCNIRDITESTNIRNEIKFHTDLINNVGQAVIATDLSGKIIYWNNAAEKIYGWSPVEAVGQNIDHLISARHSDEQAIEILQKLNAGKTWDGEFQVKRKDGSSFPAFLTDTPILDSNGKLKGIIGISSDITERKRAEMELIEAKEKAEENDRLKSSFLANMSHEIRTPMNGILGFTGLLKNHGLSGGEQEEFIDVIEKSGARLLNIINDIICISKIESEQIPITLTDTNINELMEFIYNFFKPETDQKKLYFSYKNALPDDEAFINTDSEKVYAILTNLVKNAIKFTQSGYIETGYTLKNGFIEFYVSDSGTGIPEEQREYIFERFRQGSDAFTRNYEGAGLGLAISKAYVEMLGGKLWMKNRSEEPSENGDAGKTGSVFYFTIPANFTQKTITNKPVNVVSEKTKGNSKNLKILIVEDDLNSELLLRFHIKMFAKEILHVSNGIDAVEICKKNNDIDLILMDIKIPGMNGYETTRKIRSFNKDVVIIAQTAHALSDDKEKAIAAGCNNYITKPVDEFVLNEMINSYFN